MEGIKRASMMLIRRLGLVILAAALSGCGVADRIGGHMEDTWAGELFSNQEIVRVSASADDALNPNIDGRPLSVVVRIYQLTEEEPFRSISSSLLWSDGDEILGRELLSQREVTILPGQKNVIDVSALNPRAQYVGVAAFFRDNVDSNWHVLFDADDLRHDGLLSASEGVHLRLQSNQIVVERGENLLNSSDGVLTDDLLDGIEEIRTTAGNVRETGQSIRNTAEMFHVVD